MGFEGGWGGRLPKYALETCVGRQSAYLRLRFRCRCLIDLEGKEGEERVCVGERESSRGSARVLSLSLSLSLPPSSLSLSLSLYSALTLSLTHANTPQQHIKNQTSRTSCPEGAEPFSKVLSIRLLCVSV
jgi:hypothetical protein